MAETPGRFTRRLRPHAVSVVVLALGLLVTSGFTATAAITYNHNETRLLRLRVADAGALIAEALPNTEIPLASAIELAQATHHPGQFVAYMKPYLAQSKTLLSVSLWSVKNGKARRLAGAGKPTYLRDGSATANSFLTQALDNNDLNVMRLKSGSTSRLALAYSPANTRYVAYEEEALQSNHQARISKSSEFAGLDYAIYLGHAETNATLLYTDEPRLPVTGRSASVSVPFGASNFILVMSPTSSLQGSFSEELPWFIVILGTILSIGAMVLVERLVRRRLLAEEIAAELDEAAAENQRLYDEQRSIAQTLQSALLPHELPDVAGLDIVARYLPGVAGIEIGGDWYDVVKLDDTHVLMVVGDVSGRGLLAATVMAELRYAIRAYAAEGAGPAEILTKLSQLHSVETDGRFATVVCAELDLTTASMTIANAGHLNPMVASGGQCGQLEVPVGPPIGVNGHRPYEAAQVPFPAGGTFLAFTDGLVERRGQLIDLALVQLEQVARDSTASLGGLLDEVLGELGPKGFDDDTALLGVRWQK